VITTVGGSRNWKGVEGSCRCCCTYQVKGVV
jgi:hypothetical protein